MIALLVMTDGRRGCIRRSIPSALANLHGPITRRVIHDDSGEPEYTAWLRDSFPSFEVVATPTRSGFGGAITSAWSVLAGGKERFVFHAEDDFTFNRPVRLAAMAAVLDQHPYLMQLALRRQPWNDAERAAGGIVEQHPNAYDEMYEPLGDWLEHRLFFTTNPSLYRSELCQVAWPEGGNSEGHFSHQLLEHPAVRFGFWGRRDSGEWVTHIGHERVGTGY